MRKTVLLVDASPLIYSVWNTVGHFATKAGELTGVRFGVMRSLNSWTKKLAADKTVMVYDTLGTPIKAKGVKEYKSNRIMTDDKVKMWDQIPGLAGMLELTKYTQVEVPFHEADDVIAHLARKLVVAGHAAYVMTPDDDLCQLVADGVNLFDTAHCKKKFTLKDAAFVQEKYGVPANKLLVYRALTGDSSDNLKGVRPGTARSTMMSVANEWDGKELEGISEALGLNSTEALHFLSNIKVMTLGVASGSDWVITKGKKDRIRLKSLFEGLEFKLLLKHLDRCVA